MKLPDFQNLHRNIATDVWPGGVTLTCGVCGKNQRATPDEASRYLAKGWPKCCGVTMTLR